MNTRWTIPAMIKGDYGKVTKGVEGSPFYPFSEISRHGNHPVTIWDNGGRHNEMDLSSCDLDEVPRDQAEYLVGSGNPDDESLYVEGQPITEKEQELRAKGWEYVRRTGPEDPEPLRRALWNELTQIVDDRLNLLLTPAEAAM